ncbi:mitochondrial translation release factor in rescue [Bacillus rossius redtenbacheri]|uniref:mitochondrial translation release factor in rescue n=1 Tax=Bacillus rossius redtenbacheri TaxID=93214 RepID=UPI002FDE6EF3
MLTRCAANFLHGLCPCRWLAASESSRALSSRAKHTLDYSRVPKVNEEDLEEKFVRGSGPGGQAVNKTNNCVVLMHKPSGVVVKCHQSRCQDENRRLAHDLLVARLDRLQNGDLSVEGQLRAAELRKASEQARRQRRLREMKAKWREREGLGSPDRDRTP